MYLAVFYVGEYVCMGGCVYKIKKFRTLSAPTEIASQFPPTLRSKNIVFHYNPSMIVLLKDKWSCINQTLSTYIAALETIHAIDVLLSTTTEKK
jgi:hypothetical protein